jgi:heme-degrading monooxygenase HmoA
MEQIFIDKFFVPGKAKEEFENQMNINRHFIKNLPGFIRDDVYERTDENGNFFYVTMAVWVNEEAIQNAKKEVQSEYQSKGFDMPGMLKRLNIEIDRGVYKLKIS